MMTHTETVADNGVNVVALMSARQALAEAPQAGQFTWRAECAWVRGAYSYSTISGFFGLGTEHARDTAFVIESDHPTIFAATDEAPTPVETVLAALANCLSASIASVAQNRGVQLHAVTARVEGDMDVAGVLGADPDVRNGLSAVRVAFDIKADASREDIAAIVTQAQKRSAVFDIVTNPTVVNVTVA